MWFCQSKKFQPNFFIQILIKEIFIFWHPHTFFDPCAARAQRALLSMGKLLRLTSSTTAKDIKQSLPPARSFSFRDAWHFQISRIVVIHSPIKDPRIQPALCVTFFVYIAFPSRAEKPWGSTIFQQIHIMLILHQSNRQLGSDAVSLFAQNCNERARLDLS